jgi:hypothetical protein
MFCDGDGLSDPRDFNDRLTTPVPKPAPDQRRTPRASRPRHASAYCREAQVMQARAVGRAARRSGAIGSPQVSHLP